MYWLILLVAGICECMFAFCLGKAKLAAGAAHWAWLGGFLTFTVMSMWLLTVAIKKLPVGIAYPVWTGIGAVGTVLLSIFVLKEPFNAWQIFFVILLIVSIVGLKTVS